MTKITQFSKPACKTVSEAAMKALAAVAAEHGIKLEYRGGTFTDQSFTFKLEAIVDGGERQQKRQVAEDFKFNAQFIGLKADDLGREVTIGGKKMKISGYRARASKQPIILDAADGKMYTASVETVIGALSRAVAS